MNFIKRLDEAFFPRRRNYRDVVRTAYDTQEDNYGDEPWYGRFLRYMRNLEYRRRPSHTADGDCGRCGHSLRTSNFYFTRHGAEGGLVARLCQNCAVDEFKDDNGLDYDDDDE